MKTKRNLEGYLIVDHSNSPGDARTPGGEVFESATITCSHCNSIVVLNPDRSRKREHCFHCDRYICDACAFTGICNNFERTLDTLLDAANHPLYFR